LGELIKDIRAVVTTVQPAAVTGKSTRMGDNRKLIL
jgi:hypothetical protein